MDSCVAGVMNGAWMNRRKDRTIFIKNPCYNYKFYCFYLCYFVYLEIQILSSIFTDEKIKAHRTFKLME